MYVHVYLSIFSCGYIPFSNPMAIISKGVIGITNAFLPRNKTVELDYVPMVNNNLVKMVFSSFYYNKLTFPITSFFFFSQYMCQTSLVNLHCNVAHPSCMIPLEPNKISYIHLPNEKINKQKHFVITSPFAFLSHHKNKYMWEQIYVAKTYFYPSIRLRIHITC